jgi:dipeptidyl aminopeptidase/acylaminoacyl peptidase
MSALFDFNDRVTLNGSLSKIDWRNPHIYLAVDVKSGSEQGQTWSVEGPAPNFFRTRDITKADFEGASGQRGRRRGQPCTGSFAVRADSHADTSWREGRLGLSAELLRRVQMNRTSLTTRRIVHVPCSSSLPSARPSLPEIPPSGHEWFRRSWRPTPGSSRLFDRQGRQVSTVGTRDLYNQPVFSPDGTRMAVVRADLEKETNDLWVIDNASGKAIQLTVSKTRENAGSPAWSPDGKQIAYVALRDGYFRLVPKGLERPG